MILKTARITNFKTVEDSTEFNVDRLTCLVGKNEAGKTSILKALYKLNAFEESEGIFDRADEYPRRHESDYDERHPKEPAVVVETTWNITDEESAAIIKLVGDGVVRSRELKITKNYNNESSWHIDYDNDKALRNLIEASPLTAEEKVAAIAVGKDLKLLKDHLVSMKSERHIDFGKTLETVPGSSDIFELIVYPLNLPRFVYFDSYDQLRGRVSIEQVIERKRTKHLTRDDQVFLGLLGMAGWTLEQVIQLEQFERLKAKVESVSAKISDQVFKYWTQNDHLRVHIDLHAGLAKDEPPFNTGRVVHTRIFNDRHRSSTSFDDRSTGFIWFFSFLVYFSQIKKSLGDNLIILLDEPGLSLHATAQGDILRYIKEQLLPKYQVLYTTHSPFMIPTEDLLCARIVEDVVVKDDKGRVIEIHGTKVRSDVLATDQESVFPLQGAIGYSMTQTLFVGEHTLLVEGPSDLLYIQAASSFIERSGGTALDKRWTMCPAGSIDKIAAFLALFGGQKLHLAVLTDFAHGQKKKVEDLRKKTESLMRKGSVLIASTFAEQEEADIEDVLGQEFYRALVVETYSLPQPIPASSKTGRIIEHVTAHCRTLPASIPEFNHFRPAEHLIRHPVLWEKLSGASAAKEKFTKLITALNALMPPRM